MSDNFKDKNGYDNKISVGLNLTRRDMLKTAGGLAAGAFASTLLPMNVRKALARPLPGPRSLKDIKHVVILMQENRSFDHYFGSLSGVRGFDDPHAMTISNGRSVFYQPDPTNPDGYLLPFHLDTTKTSGQKIPSTSHSWHAQHGSWNHGKMDNFVPAHRRVNKRTAPYVMSYYKRQDIPFQYALADSFTICDGYHCSTMCMTRPNRMYLMTGTIDAEGKYGGPMLSNHVPRGGFTWTTYPQRLQNAGVSWKIYKNHNGAIRSGMEFFKQFRDAPKKSALHQQGLKTSDTHQFEDDAKNDNLPAVSWIIPPSVQSEHPNHWPADGAAFVASKIDAIASNPEVWNKTAFILDYDENDGLFDHVAPPVPPEGTPGEFVHGLPIGGGFRVPCIIISPWTAGGFVCRQPFDHTSVLQFLEKFTGVREPNITAWRRKTFGDLTSVFRFDNAPAAQPTIPDAQKELEKAKYQVKHYPRPQIPESNQTMPRQEPGTRKHIPLI